VALAALVLVLEVLVTYPVWLSFMPSVAVMERKAGGT